MSEQEAQRTITLQEAQEFAYDDVDPEVWQIVQSRIMDTSRWHTHYRKVIMCVADGTFWEYTCALGSTENQDNRDFDTALRRVYPHAVSRVEYRREQP